MREEPDVVFMDVQMPEMNGYEASRAAREKGYEGPIVAVTANAVKGERDKCLAAGMDDFLTKPFKREDLVPLLDKWLNNVEFGEGRQTAEADGNGARSPAVGDPDEGLCGDPGYEIPDELIGGGLRGPQAPVFDYAAAIERFAGNEQVVRSVVERFVAKCDSLAGQFTDYLNAGDFASLQREAHGLKGGARNLEAARLGDAAAMLEAAAKMEDESRCRHYLAALEEPLQAFRDAASGHLLGQE
jgi:HPt (histidine-containing phosphotransfer) domain-containing protein